MSRGPESLFEQTFREMVREAGGATYKMAPIDAGMPDRLVLLPGGRIRLVELKAPGGKVRRIQRVWHDRARERQGVDVTILATPQEARDWLSRELST